MFWSLTYINVFLSTNFKWYLMRIFSDCICVRILLRHIYIYACLAFSVFTLKLFGNMWNPSSFDLIFLFYIQVLYLSKGGKLTNKRMRRKNDHLILFLFFFLMGDKIDHRLIAWLYFTAFLLDCVTNRTKKNQVNGYKQTDANCIPFWENHFRIHFFLLHSLRHMRDGCVQSIRFGRGNQFNPQLRRTVNCIFE